MLRNITCELCGIILHKTGSEIGLFWLEDVGIQKKLRTQGNIVPSARINYIDSGITNKSINLKKKNLQ